MEVPSKGFRVRERPQRKGVGRFHLHARIASAPSDWRPLAWRSRAVPEQG
jgi:hypothetical protein